MSYIIEDRDRINKILGYWLDYDGVYGLSELLKIEKYYQNKIKRLNAKIISNEYS